MKIPMPDEAKLALAQTQDDMTSMRQELFEIKEILLLILDELRKS